MSLDSIRNSLSKYFGCEARKSTVSTELIAGLTTFATMSYIIFIQPAVMSGQLFGFSTGMSFDALITGTCIAAAFGSILMGFLANYPVALAPGMGENFFFVLTVLPACAAATGLKSGESDTVWQTALGIVFISGVLFALLSLCNLRKLLLDAISPSMKAGITCGIGLFIALIGLRGSGIIEIDHNNLKMGEFGTSTTLIFMCGLIATAAFSIMKVRGAILFGIIVSAAIAMLAGKITPDIPFSVPPDPLPVFAKFDLMTVFQHLGTLFPLIVIFLFMDVFDTLGTLIGVGTQANLMKNNSLPNAERAFASDAAGTVVGSVCGHSTVTAFIESAAGVAQGGRTGLTAIVAGLCFLAAMFMAPFIKMVASCNAITGPALLIVGVMMMKNIKDIEWDELSESIPAFLILVSIPFSYSIGDGMMLGFIAYPIIKLLAGKHKEAGWLNYVLALVLVVYLLCIK